MNTAPLCKGYELRIPGTGESYHFAILADGTIYTTDLMPYDAVNFDARGREWFRVAEMAEGAVFVGNYHYPKLMRD